MSRALALVLSGALLSALPAVARAQDGDGPPPAPSTSIFLDILARPGVEGRDAAYDEAIRQTAAPPPPAGGVVQRDGSVRYGSVSVYVKDCPETAPLVPPPLPGRRARY